MPAGRSGLALDQRSTELVRAHRPLQPRAKASSYARPKVYAWPVQRPDGTSTDPAAIPEGTHSRLDPTLDLSKLKLLSMTRMMAEAAQRYGMIVRDQTNWAVAMFAEDPTPTGTNSYSGATGFYGGRQPDSLMKAFPWDHLQLLRMDLHGG